MTQKSFLIGFFTTTVKRWDLDIAQGKNIGLYGMPMVTGKIH